MKTFQLDGLLTNTKAPKDDRPVIITSKTQGNCRLMPSASAILGLKRHDYIAVGNVGDQLYVFRGVAGDKEAGDSQLGAKLNYASNGNSGPLMFSSQNAWKHLDGPSQKWLIDEEGKQNDGAIDYYPITNVTADSAPDEDEDEAED